MLIDPLITDFLLGIAGPLLGLTMLSILGFSRTSTVQKVLLVVLSSFSFVFYVIFGLFDFSMEVGPKLNFGLFQLSHGVSELMVILLVLVLPVALSVLLALKLKPCGRLKRLGIPILLLIVTMSFNWAQTYREIRQHQWDFEGTQYELCPAGYSCLDNIR